jgi:enoyl-CoA hydratase
MDKTESHVLIERFGALGRVRLNRPRALNSLTLPMVRAMASAVDAFEADTSVRAIFVSGEGDRGLCAGGDIRAIADSARAGDGLAAAFWREEYALNARIARCSKPYVAFMDGIVMGGGVGISAHGRYRLVTRNTRLAMPETGIGFFPDVGGSFLLPRAPGEIGSYLGLTGVAIGAADAIAAGLADTFVDTDARDAIIDALAAAGDEGDIDAVINGFALNAGEPRLREHREVIDTCFAQESVEDIVAALDRSDASFARETLDILMTRSPTSLKLTLALLRAGRNALLEECLEREFAAAVRLLDGPDFFEGVRAAVIDKDRSPSWNPALLEGVPPSLIEAYLVPGSSSVSGPASA